MILTIMMMMLVILMYDDNEEGEEGKGPKRTRGRSEKNKDMLFKFTVRI